MGRTDNPVRRVLDWGFDNCLAGLPISFILTVMGKQGDELVMRGLYAGGREAFRQAAALSQKVNLDLLETKLKKHCANLIL